MRRPTARAHPFLLLVLFFFVLLIYLTNREPHATGDSIGAVALSISVLRDGNVDLNELQRPEGEER